MRKFQWYWSDVAQLVLLLAVVMLVIFNIPNRIWHDSSFQLLTALGFIGLWRYGWWLNHFIRAQIYQRFYYPRKRDRAARLWAQGWRPRTVNFMMTTYKEDPDVTRRVLVSIVSELRAMQVPGRLFIGTGHESDELVIGQVLNEIATDIDLKTVIVRQNKPGKRFAIGLTLRAMSRHGVDGDDPVVFMDGDSILGDGCLQKCLPLFEMDSELQALTTDETVEISEGPWWVKSWLDMRFSQRHLAMQSHALSNKVLTLTGRMSVFRARNVVKLDFIRTVEADHLDHWLWHQFRFLSGDDKSTWYWLLRAGGNMTYVPDAMVITVEHIEGNGRERMVQNLMRWSGNVLRNGARALALGPRHVGLFIWWCILDQRIAMWTTLIGPLGSIVLAFVLGPQVLIAYLAWVLITRTFLSLLLFPYAGRIRAHFPIFLFLNQLLNSIVKVYLVFRLPKQRWMNRGNQKATQQGGARIQFFRSSMARYLTTLWVSGLVFSLMLYLGVLKPLVV